MRVGRRVLHVWFGGTRTCPCAFPFPGRFSWRARDPVRSRLGVVGVLPSSIYLSAGLVRPGFRD